MKIVSKLVIPLLAATLAFAAALPAQAASPAYNKSQQKGSHNTEQRDETLTEALHFDSNKPFEGGLQLGIHLVLSNEFLGPDDDWPSTLQHGGAYDSEKATLRDALLILHNYHRPTPATT